MAATTPDVVTEGDELSDDELLQNYQEEVRQRLLER